MGKFAEDLIKDIKKKKVGNKPIIRKFDPLGRGIPLKTLKEMTPSQIEKLLKGGKK